VAGRTVDPDILGVWAIVGFASVLPAQTVSH
jgi:hypothetical protein